ncbi:glyoxylate/hydroxypyruvate reductase HPR3 [Gossypium raimondii]|nr:glyoxylate/hydroxypyruvate reductase HPR3 [Gossypium raimondii]
MPHLLPDRRSVNVFIVDIIRGAVYNTSSAANLVGRTGAANLVPSTGAANLLLLFGAANLLPSTQGVVKSVQIIPFGPYENTVLNLELQLGGKRVGIVGLGSIGSEVAKRLLAFGCTIAYTSRNKKRSVSFPFYANVRDLASNSDVLVLCCALTKETYHMINKDVMVALGKEGVIINVGRGSLINEKELVQCLVGGEMGGSGLDVYENEPNVPKELFGLDNVVLSPHCAVMTPESFEALDQLIVVNLKAFFSNKPLVSVVSNE